MDEASPVTLVGVAVELYALPPGEFTAARNTRAKAIRADGDVLALHTLYFADEVRDPAELDNVPGKRAKGGSDKELDMATGLIESMSAPWKPERYRDSYQDRVRKLIKDKRKGREIVVESEPAEPTGADVGAELRRARLVAGEVRRLGGVDREGHHRLGDPAHLGSIDEALIAAGAHHDAVEDVLLLVLEHAVRGAQLDPVGGDDRRAALQQLVGDGRAVVGHDWPYRLAVASTWPW